MDVERHLYEKVIDQLIQLQVFASPEKKPSNIQAYQLHFNHEKLMWEMNFTDRTFLSVTFEARDDRER